MKKTTFCGSISMQSATKAIAVVHGSLILLVAAYISYSMVGLATKPVSDETHVTSTLTVLYEMLGITKVQEIPQNIKEISVGKLTGETSFRNLETGEMWYSYGYLKELKVHQAITVLTLTLMTLVIIFVIDVQLWTGANERNQSLCKFWFYTFSTLVTVAMGIIIPTIVKTVALELTWKFWFFSGVKCVSLFYVLWIVNTFIKELEEEEATGKGKREN